MVALGSVIPSTDIRSMPAPRRARQSTSQPSLDSFNELVLAHQDMVFRQALYILGDEAAAEDAAQEAFLRAYHNWHTFDGGPFRPWIMRIVTNYCLDQLRRRKTHPTTSLEVYNNEDEEIESPAWLNDPSSGVEEQVERGELRRRVLNCIRRLPVDYRNTVVLVDLQDMDYLEAAAILDIPMGTFKSRLARARRLLQEWLR